jgi:hypothetical protein
MRLQESIIGPIGLWEYMTGLRECELIGLDFSISRSTGDPFFV